MFQLSEPPDYAGIFEEMINPPIFWESPLVEREFPLDLPSPRIHVELPPMQYLLPRERRERNAINDEEIKSNNKNFMQEKDIKYNLYPLYINWKKIESKKKNNNDFVIFKLFGYFGAAIFDILKGSNNKEENYFNHNNFLKELFSYYKGIYIKKVIEQNIFFTKLKDIYDDVISLIKNKIVLFKEISVFLVVMKLYETYFFTINNKEKVYEVLKYEFKILSNINSREYKQIYQKYWKKLNCSYEDPWVYSQIKKFPFDKISYLENIKNLYQKLNIKTNKKKKESFNIC